MRLNYRRHYADGPFGQLHFMEAGDGPPVILLHQSPDSIVQFDPVMGLLADAGLRPIALDLPGFGMSDTPAAPPDIDAYATIVPALLDSLGIEQAHLVGHHTGAIIGTAAALNHGDRLGRLVLNGPLPLTDEERAFFMGMVEREKAWAPRWDGSHLAEQWATRFGAQPEWESLDGFNAHFVHGLLAGKEVWYAHAAVMAYHHEDALPRLQHECLILANTGDAIYAQSQRAREIRPDFAYAELKGGTIDIIDEQPDAWAAEVAAFLLR